MDDIARNGRAAAEDAWLSLARLLEDEFDPGERPAAPGYDQSFAGAPSVVKESDALALGQEIGNVFMK